MNYRILCGLILLVVDTVFCYGAEEFTEDIEKSLKKKWDNFLNEGAKKAREDGKSFSDFWKNFDEHLKSKYNKFQESARDHYQRIKNSASNDYEDAIKK
ncbi:MAG: hypothetical protein MHPSP_003824, partial [Paramarteilia canceri]